MEIISDYFAQKRGFQPPASAVGKMGIVKSISRKTGLINVIDLPRECYEHGKIICRYKESDLLIIKKEIMPQKNIETFLNKNLDYLIKKYHVEMQVLSKVTGIAISTLHRFKSNTYYKISPTIQYAVRIADFFQVTLNDLILSDLCRKQINKENNRVNQHTLKVLYNQNEYLTIFKLNRDYGTLQRGFEILVNSKMEPRDNDYIVIFNKETKRYDIKKYVFKNNYFFEDVYYGKNRSIPFDKTLYQIFGVIINSRHITFF